MIVAKFPGETLAPRRLRRVPHGRLPSRIRFLIAAAALPIGLLVPAPAAVAHTNVDLSLYVMFSPSGTISVTLPNGTPIGSANGAPTVIPAGYYTVLLSGPVGCSELGNFQLQGPGVDISSNLDFGTLASTTFVPYFAPNSTYTWTNADAPGTTYTFETSANIEGTEPTAAADTPPGFVPGPGTPSQDIVGSKATAAPYQGTLTATLSRNGAPALAFKGKTVTSLPAGNYTITITGKHATRAFVLQQSHQPAITITPPGFTGRRTLLLDLTPGQWSYRPHESAQAATFRVI